MEASEILRKPRWAPLARFVGRWYAEPLGHTVVTGDDLDRAERRLGRWLPGALREWFTLVGHRFTDVNQDRPVPLDDLELHRNRLPVWWENQGCWSFDVELDVAPHDGGGDDEPWVSVESAQPEWRRRDRLARALLGMVYSDTLVGVWSGAGVGPLGALAASVVGGHHMSAPPEVAPRLAELPELDVSTNPFFDAPLRGHEALVIRGDFDSAGIEWMAADAAAHEQATAILNLDAPEPRRLVLAFAGLPPDARAPVQRLLGGSVAAVNAVARLCQGAFAHDFARMTIELETTDPDAALNALLAYLPASAVSVMRAGHRSQSTTRFVPCWPPGSDHFTRPR